MRPGWLKKEVGAAVPGTQSPVSAKISELAGSRSKTKALSRPRIRELLTCAMIRLMERMIAELFPCANDTDPDNSFGRDTAASGPLPSFEEFLKHICRRTRTPLTCMCLALLYLTRLRANHPRSRGSPGSSYRLALSSLCVATKYLYDDAYHTCSWVQVSMGLFSQREVNQMEMEFMYFLHYQLGVTPTEWNQWIATLEAKLVARWHETGKADVIYSFGLFLSHECCDTESQEAVRDVAWGEGGRSLLELLHNAIHLPGTVDPAKCSPSAESAVSDTTCLPTPDPNSWFRIRSPAPVNTLHVAANLSGVTAASAPSASITPTTTRFSDVVGLGDDFAGSSSQPVPVPHVRHSYIDHRHVSPGLQKYATVASSTGTLTQHSSAPFALRPSSVCSVPNASYAPAYMGSGSRGGRKSRKYPSAVHTLHHHASEMTDYDWRHQQSMSQSPSHQLVPQMSSDSIMAGYSQGAKYSRSTSSPIGQISNGASGIVQSYSSESRGSNAMAGQRAHGSSSRIPLASIAAQTHSLYGTGPRPTTAQRGTLGGSSGYSEASFDRHAGRGPSGLPRVASMNAQVQGSTRSHGNVSSTYSVVELGELGARKRTQHQETAATLSLSEHHNKSRYHGSSGGPVGSSSVRGNASAKSSSSSLRANSRRQSWRHNSKHSAANFAQKLRSFAAFGWSSGGRGDDGKERGPDMQYGADDSSSLSGSGGSGHFARQTLAADTSSTFGYSSEQRRGGGDHPTQSVATMYSGSQSHYRGGSGFHTVHVEASEMAGQRAPLTNAHKGLESSYDMDIDVGKCVSMQT
ncbi:hypothetical protein IW142_003945 [Coemansia sp. RSA 564]|nr:hypothetical protein IW142_003945 [Coemansia sp. RSA 564]